MDDAPVIRATGKSLGDWFTLLDERGARELRHKEIARLLRDEHDVPGWWAQSVTVEYEKHIGRRETGQDQRGKYATTASRTLPCSMDDALSRWLALVETADGSFDGVRFAAEPKISRTDDWRYWRVGLEDGSRVVASASTKSGGEAAVVVVETGNLAARADVARWKAFWRVFLADL